MNTILFDNNNAKITGFTNALRIEKFIINSSFINQITNIKITASPNGEFFNIPFKFLIKISNTFEHENYTIIDFPYEDFFTKYLFLFHLNSLIVIFDTVNNITVNDCKLVYKIIEIEESKKERYAFSSFHIITKDFVNIKNYHAFDSRCSGFYLDLNQECNNFKLCSFGGAIFNFDFDIINLYSVIINGRKCFYLPLNFSNTFGHDLTNSINLGRLDNVKILINDNETFDGDIYAVNNIKIVYSSFFGCWNIDRSNGGLYNNIKCDTNYFEIFSNPVPIIINKKILDDKNFCNIKLDFIDNNEKYVNCETCNNNFDLEMIEQWFLNKINKKCPLCQNPWNNNNIYINC